MKLCDIRLSNDAEIIGGRLMFRLFMIYWATMWWLRRIIEEKFELLLKINENHRVNWEGNFRAPLKDAEVYQDH